MDAPYEADARRHVDELQEKIDLAEAMGDAEAVASAEADMKEYVRILGEGIGLGGRHRRAGSSSEKARVATTQAIDRALCRIRKVHSALYDHLNSAIQTGALCWYKPPTHIDWEF
jgi:hypothetical protein